MLWLIIIAGILLLLSIRIVDQYKRVVVLRLGKYSRTLMPGINFVIPFIERTIPVDMRIMTSDIPSQSVMTKDNVPVNVNGIVYFRVESPEKAVLNIRNYFYATSTYAQTVLRDVVSQYELDEILQAREKMAEDIKKIVDKRVADWGVDIVDLKIQDIVPDEKIKVAIARQAEAEREKRAVIIKATGELEAAKKYIEASKELEKSRAALYLRTLHFLNDIASSPSQKLIFVPIEIMEWFRKDKAKK